MPPNSDKGALAAHVISNLPEDIRQMVLRDGEFCARLGVVTSSVISLVEGFKFDREKLYESARKVLAGGASASISNVEGESCQISLQSGEKPVIVIEKGPQRVLHSLLVLVGGSAPVRLRALVAAAEVARLSEAQVAKWSKIVSESSLSGQQMDELGQLIGNSLTGFLENLEELVAVGGFNSAQLVPSGSSYYEQLMFGCLGNESSLEEFNSESLQRAFSAEIAKDVSRISHAFSLGAVEFLFPIGCNEIDDSNLLEYLEKQGQFDDPFSIIATISLCMRRWRRDERYGAIGKTALERLASGRPKLRELCELFSGLYALTLSRLGRHDSFRGKPVYYKRLAAFGHASLCVREIGSAGLPASDFMKWCFNTEGSGFLWSSLLDKREAPRWRMEWLDPEQIVNEVIGRLHNLISIEPIAATELGLADRISELQTGKGMETWMPFYPGPLEGAAMEEKAIAELTPENIQLVRETIEKGAGLARCIGLVAISPIWNVPNELIAEATKELDRSALPSDEKERIAFKSVLGGLGHIAGLKRDHLLADRVASLALRAVVGRRAPLVFSDVLPAVVESSAAFAKHSDQLEWIGTTLSRFAFAANRKSDAADLADIIGIINQYEEESTQSLSRARAACRSFELSIAKASDIAS